MRKPKISSHVVKLFFIFGLLRFNLHFQRASVKPDGSGDNKAPSRMVWLGRAGPGII
jgi:hypothetical protein